MWVVSLAVAVPAFGSKTLSLSRVAVSRVQAVFAINRLGLSTASRAYELLLWPYKAQGLGSNV